MNDKQVIETLAKLIEDLGGQKVKKKAGYVEHPVDEIDGEWCVDLTNRIGEPGCCPPLDTMPRVKGFGGVKFREKNGKETCWEESLMYMARDNEPPLIPIRVRIWEEAE